MPRGPSRPASPTPPRARRTIDASDTTSFTPDERCTAPALQRKAIDYYLSYWDELEPLEDDVELEVETQVLGGTGSAGGTVITVGDGGDESAISFVFDSSDELVALYQHNQSPDVRFYCKEAAAPAVDLPDVEDCVSALVGAIVHDGDEELDVSLTAAPNNLPVGLGAEIARPMQRYAATHGTSASTPLTVEGARWAPSYDKASRLEIKASGRPATTYLATDELVVLEAVDGQPAALVCTR